MEWKVRNTTKEDNKELVDTIIDQTTRNNWDLAQELVINNSMKEGNKEEGKNCELK